MASGPGNPGNDHPLVPENRSEKAGTSFLSALCFGSNDPGVPKPPKPPKPPTEKEAKRAAALAITTALTNVTSELASLKVVQTETRGLIDGYGERVVTLEKKEVLCVETVAELCKRLNFSKQDKLKLLSLLNCCDSTVVTLRGELDIYAANELAQRNRVDSCEQEIASMHRQSEQRKVAAVLAAATNATLAAAANAAKASLAAAAATSFSSVTSAAASAAESARTCVALKAAVDSRGHDLYAAIKSMVDLKTAGSEHLYELAQSRFTTAMEGMEEAQTSLTAFKESHAIIKTRVGSVERSLASDKTQILLAESRLGVSERRQEEFEARLDAMAASVGGTETRLLQMTALLADTRTRALESEAGRKAAEDRVCRVEGENKVLRDRQKLLRNQVQAFTLSLGKLDAAVTSIEGQAADFTFQTPGTAGAHQAQMVDIHTSIASLSLAHEGIANTQDCTMALLEAICKHVDLPLLSSPPSSPGRTAPMLGKQSFSSSPLSPGRTVIALVSQPISSPPRSPCRYALSQGLLPLSSSPLSPTRPGLVRA